MNGGSTVLCLVQHLLNPKVILVM